MLYWLEIAVNASQDIIPLTTHASHVHKILSGMVIIAKVPKMNALI